jgi:hypothetical protein
VIVTDLYVVGVTVLPNKTHAILIVDAYAVLPGPVTPKRLKAVTRWNAQKVQRCGGTQLRQFAPGSIFDVDPFTNPLTVGKGFRVFISERPDQALSYIDTRYKTNSYGCATTRHAGIAIPAYGKKAEKKAALSAAVFVSFPCMGTSTKTFVCFCWHRPQRCELHARRGVFPRMTSFRRRPESSLNMRPKDTTCLCRVLRTMYSNWIPAFAEMTTRVE